MSPRAPQQTTFLVAAVLAIATAASVRAQPPAGADRRPGELIPRADAQQTYLVRSLLKFVGVEPVNSLPRRGELKDVVLVAFGQIQPDTIAEASIVLANGGAVFIATDKPTNLRPVFPLAGPFAAGLRQVESINATPDTCFNGDRSMPYLVPPDKEYENPDVARMAALRQVATNGPSSFTRQWANTVDDLGQPIALFPRSCRYTTGGRLEIPVAGLMNDPQNSVGSVLVVYADGGIFTNQMLMARGTDNFAYTYYLARYLTTGPTGNRKRNKCKFVEDGEVRTDFDAIPLSPAELPPLPPPPVPSLEDLQEKITDTANAALDDLQTRDVLGRAAANNFGRIAPALALVAAIFAAVVLARLTWSARHQSEFTAHPPPAADRTGSTLDQRRQEVLRSNDVYEPLREHLRGLFGRWGGPGGDGPDLPPVETAGTSADRRILLAKLRKLWEIAYGDAPKAIPFIRWKELEPMIESVTQAAEAGRWRFARPGGAA